MTLPPSRLIYKLLLCIIESTCHQKKIKSTVNKAFRKRKQPTCKIPDKSKEPRCPFSSLRRNFQVCSFHQRLGYLTVPYALPHIYRCSYTHMYGDLLIIDAVDRDNIDIIIKLIDLPHRLFIIY